VERVISIIGDDESIRSALVGLMRSLGYAARGFDSAEEFLDSRVMQSVACIITDIQMPG
jgi:FixJ family two-component response regulator